jgi:hypothetical protein
VEIILPHRVTYQIDGRASVADVVEALLGTEQLLRETIPLLEGCAPGLTIEKIAITVERISQDSPLRQALYVALFAVFQKDFEKAVPMIAEKLFGLGIPPEYNPVLTIASVSFCFSALKRSTTKLVPRRLRAALESTWMVQLRNSQKKLASLSRSSAKSWKRATVRVGPGSSRNPP